MRPAGFRFLRHLASPLTTPLIRRSPPTQAPRLHSRAFQTSRRCWQQNDVVIVRRPWFTRRKVALVVVQGLCIYTCWGFIIRKLDSVLDDVELEPAEDGDEDSSLFIPLSFPKVLPQEYYKSTDPEWREFVKFSKDAKRKKGVREELAKRVLADIAKHPKTQAMLGKNIRLTKHWFEIKFPDGPAPEYARLALELTDEYIALSDQTIDNAHFITLSNVMKPRAAWAAVKNTAWMFYTIQKTRAKAYLGMSISDPHEQQVALLYKLVSDATHQIERQEALEAQKKSLESTVQKQSKAIDQLLGKKSTDSTTPPPQSKPARDPQPAEPRFTGLPSPIPSHVWERINSTFNPFASATSSSARGTPSPSPSDSDLSPGIPIPTFPSLIIAIQTFHASLVQGMVKTRTDPQPPGSFHIFGELEVIGEKAKAKCDVKAAYDPKAAKFVWVVCDVKHLWEVKQRPKGGV